MHPKVIFFIKKSKFFHQKRKFTGGMPVMRKELPDKMEARYRLRLSRKNH